MSPDSRSPDRETSRCAGNCCCSSTKNSVLRCSSGRYEDTLINRPNEACFDVFFYRKRGRILLPRLDSHISWRHVTRIDIIVLIFKNWNGRCTSSLPDDRGAKIKDNEVSRTSKYEDDKRVITGTLAVWIPRYRSHVHAPCHSVL